MLIYFIGYITAGKSSWGQKLAKELNYNFIDTRKIMMQESGLTFAQLLQNRELFIELEQNALSEVSKLKNTVVATSELLPCRANNMDILNSTGITFYLKAGVGCIMMKLGNKASKIPLLQGIEHNFIPDFIKTELANRKPIYSKAQINYMARELSMEKLLSFFVNT